jgi:hypothetical protein
MSVGGGGDLPFTQTSPTSAIALSPSRKIRSLWSFCPSRSTEFSLISAAIVLQR